MVISVHSILNIVKEVDTRLRGYDRKYKPAGVYPGEDGAGMTSSVLIQP